MLPVPANLTSTIGFAPTWDLLVFIVVIAAMFLYGMTSGKGKILTLLLSTYFSFLIITLAPWKEIGIYFNYAKDFPSATFEIFIFLALIIASCFLLPNSVIGSISRIGRGGKGAWWQTAVFSVLEAGLLTSVILSLLPAQGLGDINSLLKQFFTGQFPQFIWILMPILAMVLLRRGRVE